MTSNDIMIRGSLLAATLLLLSIFTGQLMSMKDDRTEEDLRDLAREMSDIFRDFSDSDTPSIISISFDDSGERSTISLSGTIGDRHPTLMILPGAVFLEHEGTRVSVSEYSGIIPAYPPINEIPFDRDTAGLISRVSGGYSLTLTGTLNLENRQPGIIFVYPGSEEVISEIGLDLVSMEKDPFIPSMEWDRRLVIEEEDMICLHRDHFLLLEPASTATVEGICPLLYIIPRWVDILMEAEIEEHHGEISINRMVIPDGEAFVPSWIIEVH